MLPAATVLTLLKSHHPSSILPALAKNAGTRHPHRCWCRRDQRLGHPPLPLLRPPLTLHHHPSQDPVDSRLVARTFGFEPVHHFGIHAQRDPPLARTVPARLRARLLLHQRQQVVLNRSMQPGNRPRPGTRLPPLCFLSLSCHDAIVCPPT